jgi:hypothetical protein
MNKTTRQNIAAALRQAAHTLARLTASTPKDRILRIVVDYVDKEKNLSALNKSALLDLLEGVEIDDDLLKNFAEAHEADMVDDELYDLLSDVFDKALRTIDKAVERQAEEREAEEAKDNDDAENWLGDGIAARYRNIDNVTRALTQNFSRNDEAAEIILEAKEAGISDEDIFGALETASTATTVRSSMSLVAMDNDSKTEVDTGQEAINGLTIEAVSDLYNELDGLFSTSSRHDFDPSLHNYFYYRLAVGWNINTDDLRRAITGFLPEDEEGVGPPEVVYKFKNGFQVVSLKPGHLVKEGCEGGICIGQRKHGYYDALKNGEIAVYSLRTPSDKVKLTIEVELDGERPTRVLQVKGKANRLPGFDLGRQEFKHVEEVEMAMEFVSRYLHLDPADAPDLAPGVTALAEWKKQDAERRARQKAEHASRRLQGSASHPLSENVRRLIARADRYDLRLEQERR